jgi:hypothetical protein
MEDRHARRRLHRRLKPRPCSRNATTRRRQFTLHPGNDGERRPTTAVVRVALEHIQRLSRLIQAAFCDQGSGDSSTPRQHAEDARALAGFRGERGRLLKHTHGVAAAGGKVHRAIRGIHRTGGISDVRSGPLGKLDVSSSCIEQAATGQDEDDRRVHQCD